MINRQLVGAIVALILAAPLVRGQDGSVTNRPTPPVVVPSASTVTNPPSQTPLNVPQPAVPEMTVPQPATVNIPIATDQPSSAPVPRPRAMPLATPGARELLTKSIQSAPGGSQNRLDAIPTVQAPQPNTNAAANLDVAAPPLTNSTAHSTNTWQKNTPLLNGVDYHW